MGNASQTALTNVGIFSTLKSSDRERLAQILKPRSFGVNETIFFQQDPGHCLYLIHHGKIKICCVNPEGVELIFAFLSDGDILGEMSILDEKPRSTTAIAVQETETSFIERQDFLDFLQTSPQACIDIISMLCRRLRKTDKHLEEVSFLDVSCRVARKLVELTGNTSLSDSSSEYNLTCGLSQEELARLVGASRVITNKILNSYVDLGLLKLARKKISIINPKQLTLLAHFEY
ncbi:MAG: Crp/Fnr family transcriptional regulator [Dehalococcoidales bacterium]|nr:Crp/Fnr family transcriptional regulator [Dehalococcoidales bacterium]